jgi:hypothetical protein
VAGLWRTGKRDKKDFNQEEEGVNNKEEWMVG